MKAQLMKFWKDEDGATAIEYGLIAGLIAVAIIGGVGLVGTNLGTLFDNVADAVPTEAPANGTN